MRRINIEDWQFVRSLKDGNVERSVNNLGVDLYRTPEGEFRAIKWTINSNDKEREALERLRAEYDLRNFVVELFGETRQGYKEGTVLEALVGENGWGRFDRNTEYPTPFALDYIRLFGEGLANMHTKGYAHGDLKEDEIFVSSRPMSRVKLVDFGYGRWPNDNDIGLSFEYNRQREIRLAAGIVQSTLWIMESGSKYCLHKFTNLSGSGYNVRSKTMSSDNGLVSLLEANRNGHSLLHELWEHIKYLKEFRQKIGPSYSRPDPSLDRSSIEFKRITSQIHDTLIGYSKNVPWQYVMS